MKKRLLIILLLITFTGFSQEQKTSIRFAVYPNPVQDNFSITVDSTIRTVKIYTVLGKEVARFEKQDNYNISSLKKGIYLLYVETSVGSSVRKLAIK